jgi:hypothetical protein
MCELVRSRAGGGSVPKERQESGSALAATGGHWFNSQLREAGQLLREEAAGESDTGATIRRSFAVRIQRRGERGKEPIAGDGLHWRHGRHGRCFLERAHELRH